MSELWVFMLIWGVWIMIPIIVDGLETLLRIGVIIYSRMRKPEEELEVKDNELPNITVIIPAYNEEKIINRCIASLKVQDYPQEKLDILLIDDGSTDNTVKRIINYAVGRNINGTSNGNGNRNGNGKLSKYAQQLIKNGYANGTVKINGHQYPVPDFSGSIKLLSSDFHIGKPEALNTAVDNANGFGDLIITVDSDVVLEKDALRRTAEAFIADPKMGAATCNIEVSWQNMVEIDENGDPLLDKKGHIVSKKLGVWENILAKCQFLEYLDSFCLGREFQSRFHSTYILAGAFSAFRRDVLRKIYYREVTVTEDFDLTVDIHRMNYYIGYVAKAKAYVEPVTDWDHLYAQRVRWHRGQLEVSGLHKDMIGNKKFGKMGWFGFPQMLLGDHTLSFPRLIWTPLILFFGLFGYPFHTIMTAVALMYMFYVGITFIQIACAYMYVNDDSKGHVEDALFYSFIMPFYRLATFYFRMSGYLLVLKEPPRWQVVGPMNGLKNGINGFKNGIANGVADVKNGFNGYGNGGKKKVKEVNNGFANGYNGFRNGLYILRHGFKGFFVALKVHQHRKPVYNNGVNPRSGLRSKDEADTRVLQEAYAKARANKPVKDEGFDLNRAFPRIKPPVEPYKMVLSPRNMESYLSEAYYYLHRESFEQAQIPFDEAIHLIEKTSDLSSLHLELAKSLFYSGDDDRAWVHLKQAAIITHDEGLKKQIRESIKALPQKYHEPDASSMVVEAFDHLEKNEIYEARDSFRKAIELSDNSSDIAFLRLQISRTYYLANEKQSAHQDFNVANLVNKELGENDKNFEALEETIFNEDAQGLDELIDEGNQAYGEKNYNKARECFSKALAKSKDLAQLVLLEIAVAKTYFLSKRYEPAREHLNRAVLLDPNAKSHPEYQFIEKSMPEDYQSQSSNELVNQAYSSLEDGEYARARTLFKMTLEKANDLESLILGYLELGRLFYLGQQPRKARLNLNNALILSRSTHQEELAKQIEEVINRLPKYYIKGAFNSLVSESLDLIELGQYDKARMCINKGFALARDAGDLAILKMELGKVYGYAKQFKKANKELREALLMAPGNSGLKEEIKSLLAYFPEGSEVNYDILVEKGYNYLSRKNYKKAEKAFVESFSHARDHYELILSYLEIARIKKILHHLDEAQAILTNALNLAKALKMSPYIKAEIDSAMQLVKADMGSIKLNKSVNKAYEYLHKRDYRKARAHITQVFAHANDVESVIVARMELGKMYALSGQYKRASIELSAALRLASETKKEQLENEIKNLLAHFPKTSPNFEALIKQGEMLQKNGRPVRAQRIFEKVSKMAKTPEELVRLYIAQGQARIAGKDREQGKRDLTRALILSQEYGKMDVVKEINELLMAS